MRSCDNAMHVRTGDRGTGYAINAWLERHQVLTVNCEDAFEACATMLTRPDLVPAIALVGTRWLEPDEYALLDYLRETWPHVAIVLYGNEAPRSGRDPLMFVARLPQGVRKMLAESPATLLEQIVKPRVQPEAAPSEKSINQPRGIREPEASSEGSDETDANPGKANGAGERQGAEGGDRIQTSGRGDGPPQPSKPAAPETILTREELAALLEDDAS